MQVLSVTIFEKIRIQTALSSEISTYDTVTENNQLGSPSRQKIGIGCGTMPVNRSPMRSMDLVRLKLGARPRHLSGTGHSDVDDLASSLSFVPASRLCCRSKPA